MLGSNKITIAAAMLALAPMRWAQAGISVIDQSREVGISGQAQAFGFDGYVYGPAYNHLATAAPYAPFNQQFMDQSTVGPVPALGRETSPQIAESSASQESQITADANSLTLTATGSLSAGAGGDSGYAAFGRSLIRIVFSLDTPGQYVVNEIAGDNGSGPDIIDSGILLLPGVQPGLNPNFLDFEFPSDSLTPDLKPLSPMPRSYEGTLAPGTYTLLGGGYEIASSEGVQGFFTEDVTITTAPTSVPVPAAFYMGMIAIALISAGLLLFPYRQRRSHC